MSDLSDYLYSVRMRASSPEGRHVSGAERIVREADVPAVSSELLQRALSRSAIGEARVSVDRRAAPAVHAIPCLPVVQLSRPELLTRQLQLAAWGAGLDERFLSDALDLMLQGAVPQGGAALVDRSMRPLHAEARRGVRVKHFDYSPAGREEARSALERAGLGHFRTFEALALASKVAWSGMALEICWSDEPDYLTGYVASPKLGYIRVPDWKPEGAPGGRIFVLEPGRDPAECIRRLEEEWALIEPPVEVRTELQGNG